MDLIVYLLISDHYVILVYYLAMYVCTYVSVVSKISGVNVHLLISMYVRT